MPTYSACIKHEAKKTAVARYFKNWNCVVLHTRISKRKSSSAV